MVKIAILYHSRSLNVHKLATTAAAYAEKAGAEVRLRRFPELPQTMVVAKDAYAQLAEETKENGFVQDEDLIWADSIMIGSPVHFGGPAPEIVHFFDHTAPIAVPGHLMTTTASVFASGSASHSGAQTTLIQLYNMLAHWGCVIVPTGASVKLQLSPENGSPYGTCSISRHKIEHVHEDNLALMEFQTQRVLEVTTALQLGLQQTESKIEYASVQDVLDNFSDMSMDV